jgi:membrane fusion protein (multidrug efflux system)
VRAAEARLREIKLNLGYTQVTAPIAGLSSRAPKSEAASSTPTTRCSPPSLKWSPMWIPFAIAENQQLQLNKAVSEGRLMLPKDNAFDVQVRLADGSMLDRKGRINFSDTRINPSTGTFEMRAEVTNRDGLLKPGPVRARLELWAPCATTALACRKSR